MTPVNARAGQSYMPTRAMCPASQWNGLTMASGASASKPLAIHSRTITALATPAEPERPRIGARTNARPPKKSAMKPIHRAKPTAESGAMVSPRAGSPKSLELATQATASTAIAIPSIVRWAVTFSIAIRRLPNGADATMSRLPRLASPARVPDRAMIDHRVVPMAKIAPYFQVK